MDVKGIVLTNLNDFSMGGDIYCVRVRPDWKYIDGKPSDIRLGTKYDVVFPANGFLKATVKTPEMTAALTSDDVVCNNGSVKISLNHFTATVYVDNRTNRAAFSLKADAVIPITK